MHRIDADYGVDSLPYTTHNALSLCVVAVQPIVSLAKSISKPELEPKLYPFWRLNTKSQVTTKRKQDVSKVCETWVNSSIVVTRLAGFDIVRSGLSPGSWHGPHDTDMRRLWLRVTKEYGFLAIEALAIPRRIFRLPASLSSIHV